jgi:deoxycytidine triphosphate deaminase
LNLPDNVAATAYGINGQTSKGLLVINSGHVDPGFIGPLTVTAINLTKEKKIIRVGDPIMTVVFQRLPEATLPYEGNIARVERLHFLTSHCFTP